MASEADSKTLAGWTYFSAYRNHSLYVGDAVSTFGYAAGDNDGVWIFDHSFEKLRAQLDEITKDR